MRESRFLYVINIETNVNSIYNKAFKQRAGAVMKTVKLRVEGYLYAFYEKVGTQAGRTAEQVMADALFRFAGEACAAVQENRRTR